MDPRTFYFLFVATFTVLAFLIGASFAIMAIGANTSHPPDDDSAPAH